MLKYAFVVSVSADDDGVDQFELMPRNSVFLAPWERASAVPIPENAVCRGSVGGEFFVHKNSAFVPLKHQKALERRFIDLVLKECVLSAA